MEHKSLKKSTLQQLQSLVDYMADNPEFARGAPVFGASRSSVEEKWKILAQKLNSLGPPTRSISDWKKTWADLKSRTKKKIAENKKSLLETGGGLYKHCNLTGLEQSIDRTLLLSSAAAPSGSVFGGWVENAASESIEDCFQPLVITPQRGKKVVAVITPNRASPGETMRNSEANDRSTVQSLEQGEARHKNAPKRRQSHGSDLLEMPPSSSAKKRKTTVDEQLSLIRRQIRVAERNAATATEQATAMKRMADAAESQAESAKTTADAIKLIAEATLRIEF